jgi:hypothetical protein
MYYSPVPMVCEVSLVGQTPSSALDPLVRLFHNAQDRPTRASAADQGVCPTMRFYSMNYGDRRLADSRGDAFSRISAAVRMLTHGGSTSPELAVAIFWSLLPIALFAPPAGY